MGQPGLPELPVLRVLIAARGLGAMARVKERPARERAAQEVEHGQGGELRGRGGAQRDGD